VNNKGKKLSCFEKMLCMNVEIHKENYFKYKETCKIKMQNKEILRNQHLFANDAPRRAGEEPIPAPSMSATSSTIQYHEFNTSKVEWTDFDNITSKPLSKGKEDVEESKEEEAENFDDSE
jgi:hypothetical protein